jgi:hypothetical protein
METYECSRLISISDIGTWQSSDHDDQSFLNIRNYDLDGQEAVPNNQQSQISSKGQQERPLSGETKNTLDQHHYLAHISGAISGGSCSPGAVVDKSSGYYCCFWKLKTAQNMTTHKKFGSKMSVIHQMEE